MLDKIGSTNVVEQKNIENGQHVLPIDMTPFENQLAGHVYIIEERKIRMMKDSEGYLIKPNIPPRELNFYNTLETTNNPLLKELKEYVPTYLGITKLKLNKQDITCIKMEDTTKGFKIPCIMDVKIGAQSYEPGSTKEMILRYNSRYAAIRKHLGFCIPGVQYYSRASGNSVRKGNEFSHFMSPEQGIQVLYNFVYGEAGIKFGLVESILEQLRKIKSWFERQKQLLFFDSSILLAYDANNLMSFLEANDSSCNDCERIDNHKLKVEVRMIDFAHVLPSTNNLIDENYLTSLEKLIYVFENLTELYANRSKLFI